MDSIAYDTALALAAWLAGFNEPIRGATTGLHRECARSKSGKPAARLFMSIAPLAGPRRLEPVGGLG
jgi:hypothetical protein